MIRGEIYNFDTNDTSVNVKSIRTVNGFIPRKEWLKKEIARINPARKPKIEGKPGRERLTAISYCEIFGCRGLAVKLGENGRSSKQYKLCEKHTIQDIIRQTGLKSE